MKKFKKPLRCNGSGSTTQPEKRLQDQRKSAKHLAEVFGFTGVFQGFFWDQIKEKKAYKAFSLLGFPPPGPMICRDTGRNKTPLPSVKRNRPDAKNSRSESCDISEEKR